MIENYSKKIYSKIIWIKSVRKMLFLKCIVSVLRIISVSYSFILLFSAMSSAFAYGKYLYCSIEWFASSGKPYIPPFIF